MLPSLVAQGHGDSNFGSRDGQRACHILTCDPLGERGDCNARFEDGCESDLESDALHCGECGHACASGESCIAGVCD